MLIEEYEYRNVPIPGGGYVTGFVYHEKEKGLLYLRTDIGGTYRWNPLKEEWNSLVDHVTMEDLRETFPVSIALCKNNPEKMFVASGTDDKNSLGCLSVSNNRGRTFIKKEMPMFVHGNLNGRGTDERLMVSEKTGKIYMASQQDGLWESADEGDSWKKVNGMKEKYLTFVSEVDGALLIGTAGVTTMSKNGVRGHGLYLSNDEGKTFEKVTYEENHTIPEVEYAGLVPHRWCRDEKYLYVTFACNGRHAYAGVNGFSCDGGSTIEGRVYRFEVQNENGKIYLTNPKDISPIKTQGILECGFGGINVAQTRPGMVCVATICKDDGDCIFRSYDYGESWECILKDLEIGKMNFHTSYMKPEYNGGRNIIHWLTDLKINPFDENEMWFNTGTGVFRTRNLTQKEVVFLA